MHQKQRISSQNTARRHMAVHAFSPPRELCSQYPKGCRVCTGAPTDPPQRNPFFIFLLAPNLTSTLKPLLINFLYVCISARSKGPWDRGCAVQVPYVIFGWPHNAPHSQLLKTGTDSSSPCFPMYFRRQIKRSPR